MYSSLSVTFTGDTSVLKASFLPEIILDEKCDYSCAFLDLVIKNISNLNEFLKMDVIRINCDIISDSYINGERAHTIHQFITSVSTVKGQSIIEIPKNLNYFLLKTRNLRTIQISLTDHSGKLIDLHGGDIICRINIKREPCEITH